MNLQETLRQNRINRHLTQGSVARRLNVRQQMVSKIEKNPGVSLISVVRYAECIGDEVIVVPSSLKIHIFIINIWNCRVIREWYYLMLQH